MELYFDKDVVSKYTSGAQIARVLTEKWVEDNMFCPRCGHTHLHHFQNNRPVADFYCPICNNEYELKSKKGMLGRKINDGAYDTMIERITSNNNPDFFFMSYSKDELKVRSLVLIPNHFFIPDIIEKRKPLSATARRSGWIGCNILIDKIPIQGRIPIISNGMVFDTNSIIQKVQTCDRLKIENISNRGWLMDVLNCVNRIPNRVFTLNEVYSFERELHEKHPQNNNIKPKIRQQLQFLRDKGFIAFLGNGKYVKIA